MKKRRKGGSEGGKEGRRNEIWEKRRGRTKGKST